MSKVLMLIKEKAFFKDKRTVMKLCLAMMVFVFIVSAMAFASYSETVNKSLADNLIRLHVIANSDSEQDQALKRDVRDVIIDYMKKELDESKDIKHTREIIQKDLQQIEALAAQEIHRQGKDYPVKAMLGNYPFPTKLYGDVALPAGEYEALRIVIGNGEGANWWCVLFPPLCFVDATHGTVPDSVKQDLKETLSTQEYELITTADKEEDIPVKVKFKIVELFQGSKVKFSGLLSRWFK